MKEHWITNQTISFQFQRVIATRLNEELPDQVNRFVTGDRVGAVWKSDHSAVIPT